MGGDVIAERLDLLAREGVVLALDLLQADGVGRDLLEIIEQVGQALAHRIDVPGGEDQGETPGRPRPPAMARGGAARQTAWPCRRDGLRPMLKPQPEFDP